MKYSVYFIADAENDLMEIYKYIARNDSVDKADYVLNKLEETCASFESNAHRGHVPPELGRINVREYLEIHFQPYRVIYQISGKKVFIHGILDGRRSLEDLLQRRLLN
ncbi:MAG: type II toxin-antitoxin system RelE/ParE family toxin [Deltaproteobacteria bacterium]|nr:type II toxin-antitoxin system RelE/ParE family toxin [Deltaproteobacteria bacterium]